MREFLAAACGVACFALAITMVSLAAGRVGRTWSGRRAMLVHLLGVSTSLLALFGISLVLLLRDTVPDAFFPFCAALTAIAAAGWSRVLLRWRRPDMPPGVRISTELAALTGFAPLPATLLLTAAVYVPAGPRPALLFTLGLAGWAVIDRWVRFLLPEASPEEHGTTPRAAIRRKGEQQTGALRYLLGFNIVTSLLAGVLWAVEQDLIPTRFRGMWLFAPMFVVTTVGALVDWAASAHRPQPAAKAGPEEMP